MAAPRLCITARSPTMNAMRPPLILRMTHMAAVLAVGAMLLSPASAQNPADADIVAAKAAFDRGDAVRLADIAPRVQSHVLAPYVTYWQLELGLDTANAATLRAFLQRWAGTPFAERLRIDWLKSRARAGGAIARCRRRARRRPAARPDSRRQTPP